MDERGRLLTLIGGQDVSEAHRPNQARPIVSAELRRAARRQGCLPPESSLRQPLLPFPTLTVL